MTFADFKTLIRDNLFPEGIAENLVTVYDTAIVDAMIDLQRWVPCLQANHLDIYPQCATYWRCGLTCVDMPPGRINRVFTTDGQNYCSRLHYRQVDYATLERYSRKLSDRYTAPANAGMTVLPFGYKYPEAATDSIYGRATFGLWAIYKKRLFLGPWIQSTESLVVDWDGIKRDWRDVDVVKTTTEDDSFPWGPDAQRAIRLFCQQERPQDFVEGRMMAGKWAEDWKTARADLIYECGKVSRVQPTDDTRSIVDGEMVDLENLLAGYPYSETDV